MAQKSTEAEPGVMRELLGWLVYIVIIVGLTFLIITYVGQRTRVDGSSMEPSLTNGDNLIVDKVSYRFQDPERYDIIVFPWSEEDKIYYIKRIIGLPGETVQVKAGEVYINGNLLGEHYGAETMESAGIAEEPIVLGEDEYFLLGDNRNHSSDSRDPGVGIISRDRIMGKAWLRIWPLNSFGVVKHE